MLKRFALAAAAVVALAAPAAAQTWKIDSAHSTASFTVRHMMVSNVHGRFGKLEGSIVYDGKNIAGAHGIFNLTPNDHQGFDQRARVMVTIENNTWKLVK